MNERHTVSRLKCVALHVLDAVPEASGLGLGNGALVLLHRLKLKAQRLTMCWHSPMSVAFLCSYHIKPMHRLDRRRRKCLLLYTNHPFAILKRAGSQPGLEARGEHDPRAPVIWPRSA